MHPSTFNRWVPIHAIGVAGLRWMLLPASVDDYVVTCHSAERGPSIDFNWPDPPRNPAGPRRSEPSFRVYERGVPRPTAFLTRFTIPETPFHGSHAGKRRSEARSSTRQDAVNEENRIARVTPLPQDLGRSRHPNPPDRSLAAWTHGNRNEANRIRVSPLHVLPGSNGRNPRDG